MKPDVNFFVIGAARSGTTSLYRTLETNESVFVPHMKEPRFFNLNRAKGWAWYASHFADKTDGQIAGDFSPSYSHSASIENTIVAERIARNYPKAKIIYLVRNPIDCAISNWRMIAEIKEQQLTFSEALDDPAWATAVLHRVMFYRQISIYRKFFKDDQILIVTLESIKKNPRESLVRIYEFLEIEDGKLDFIKRNASHRKPNRPGIPIIDTETRVDFISRVADDSKKMLDYCGLDPSFWEITTRYKGWKSRKAGILSRFKIGL